MENKNFIVLNKMKNYANKIVKYTGGKSFEEFSKDTKTLEACVFNMSQIGELVKLVDKDLINNYTNVNWVAIKNLRNRIVHDYEGIQFNIIWIIITKNLPQLIKDIDAIIEKEMNK